MDSTPPYAALALTITAQDWVELGLGDDPNTAATSDFDVTVERVTAIFLVRVVAVNVLAGTYEDLSTTTICRSALVQKQKWPWPINDEMMLQLRKFIRIILSGYNDTPYHNWEHAYHVVISINKLLDLMLNNEIQGEGMVEGDGFGRNRGGRGRGRDEKIRKALPPMYGLRSDPLMQMVLLFSALIHDVEHTGVPNRQLSIEKHELALLYNDKSIAENRALYIGFSTLLSSEFKLLREAMLPDDDDYFRFRKACVDVVLATDIASPERTQIGKSKWKEAFGEDFETVERKVRSELKRMTSTKSMGMEQPTNFVQHPRRGTGMTANSILSEISTDRTPIHEKSPGWEESEEESLSITPDVSVDGNEDNEDLNKTEGEESLHTDSYGYPIGKAMGKLSMPTMHQYVPPARRSFNSTQHRPASLRNFIVEDMEEHAEDSLGYSNELKKFNRRCSVASVQTQRYRQRLSIARAIDLNGEFVETYSRGSANLSSAAQQPTMVQRFGRMASGPAALPSQPRKHSLRLPDEEDDDELKQLVVMEQLMLTSDVAHNIQGWEQMVKWSNRLFLELRKAYIGGRGPDPKPRWYENQIGFLESYLLPLARRLEDTLVFGDLVGPVFARIVEANRDQWLSEGINVTEQIVKEGEKKFPFKL